MAKSSTGSKSKKSTVTATESVSSPVLESAPVEVPVVQESQPTETQVSVSSESNPVVSEESSTELLFKKLLNQFQDVQNIMKTLHSNLKVLEKEVAREKKESKKKESKKKSVKKQLSGFAKASPISNDLANFLGLSHDSQIARTEVTSKVIAYVKQFNLQNPEDKKQIVPDAKLSALLQSGTDRVTFFNLQTYLKKHFLPSISTSTVETSTPSATVV
jgi:chromatin remodeling complex protein RSC6